MAGGLHKTKVRGRHISESTIMKIVLIALAVLFVFVMIVLPLLTVLFESLEKGFGVFIDALTHKDALAALKLTLITALIVVPLNTIFGVLIAWAITKFKFRGKQLLITLVDLPFAVSPVIAGLVFILLFGASGFFGDFLFNNDIKIIFAIPGIVIATLFITVPFVAREIIPLMEQQGIQEEEAAISLGAKGFQVFWKVTLPNIKWGLLYGIILCNARVMGEFGAVSVVSGHIRGKTNTLPLHVEILYNEYQFTAAFAVASLLMLLAIFTLVIKGFVEWKESQQAKKEASFVVNSDVVSQ